VQEGENPDRLKVPASGGLSAMLSIANADVPAKKATVNLKPKFKKAPPIPEVIVEEPVSSLKPLLAVAKPAKAVAPKPAPVADPVPLAEPAAVVEPVTVAESVAVAEPVAVAEKPAPAAEPVAIVEPVAVAEKPAPVAAEPVPEFTQIQPKDIKKAAIAAAKDQPAPAEPVEAGLKTESAEPVQSAGKASSVPVSIIAAVLALIAAAAAAIRFRAKRNSPNRRNKP